MLEINREQVDFLRKSKASKSKKICIVRTCKGNSKRGKYYVEETCLVKSLLDYFERFQNEKYDFRKEYELIWQR